MSRMLALHAGTDYHECMQYTLRGVPPRLDEVIRARAKASGKSLNEVALAALAEGAGLGAEEVVRRDLSDIAGTWRREAAVEEALAAQDQIDQAVWE